MTLEFVEEASKSDEKPADLVDVADPKGTAGTEADSLESVATELGWNAEYDGEDKVDAKTFLLKSREIQDTMRNHIKDQKGQLKELTSSVAELKSHNERVYKAEVSKLKSELETLKEEKREAIEDGDVDKVDELDEKIDGVEDAIKEPEKKEDTGNNEEFEAWVAANKWYEKDPEMAAYADAIASESKGASFQRVAALVDRKVREMFPDRFSEKALDTPKAAKTTSRVERSGGRPQGKQFTKTDLTDSQKAIMSQFVRQGIMTEKQYIADIAKTEGAA